MNKRIFNWNHSKNKKYADRKCPNFDFVGGCADGTIIWWNETQFCVDMDKFDDNQKEKQKWIGY